MSEPVCTEVSISSSVGGKVQIVKFEYSADFHYSMARKYSVPEEWDADKLKTFQLEETRRLRTELEEVAQVELDELTRQRDGE